MIRCAVGSLVWLGLTACGGGDLRERFEGDFAGVWCERQEQCALGEFEDDYSSFADCVDDKEDDLDIPRSDDAGCEVDPDEADDCLDWMETADCADWVGRDIEDACDRVFTDC